MFLYAEIKPWTSFLDCDKPATLSLNRLTNPTFHRHSQPLSPNSLPTNLQPFIQQLITFFFPHGVLTLKARSCPLQNQTPEIWLLSSSPRIHILPNANFLSFSRRCIIPDHKTYTKHVSTLQHYGHDKQYYITWRVNVNFPQFCCFSSWDNP